MITISKEKFRPVSAVSEHPHQFGRWAVSLVVGEFASKEEAEVAQGMLDRYVATHFVMLEDKPLDVPPKKNDL